MSLAINGLLFDELTSDPGAPAEGQVWYNTTTKQLKVYRNGGTDVLIDKATFDGHANSTSNPHTTTLEQARTAGSTLAGDINMNNNKITNIGAGVSATDAAQRGWVTDQINQKIRGLDWQESVLSRLTTPPGSPVGGDRYLIIATATGDWATKEDQIAEWDGDLAAWVYIIPTEGAAVRVEAENLLYTYDGAAWGNMGSVVDHAVLLNLTTGDPHTQYQLRSEKNAANGYAGLTASGDIDDTRHGNRSGGSLHSLVSSSTSGFMPQSHRAATVNPTVNDDGTAGYLPGSRWLNVTAGTEWVCISNGTGAAVWVETTNVAGVLKMKSGTVLNATFAGNPKKATVTFSAAFADANYSVAMSCVTQNNKQFVPVVESQVAGSFVINVGVNSITDLIQVHWSAIKHGESV